MITQIAVGVVLGIVILYSIPIVLGLVGAFVYAIFTTIWPADRP